MIYVHIMTSPLTWTINPLPALHIFLSSLLSCILGLPAVVFAIWLEQFTRVLFLVFLIGVPWLLIAHIHMLLHFISVMGLGPSC